MPIDAESIDNNARPLFLEIADRLAEQIDQGRLSPGEKLPTHRELSHLLGVARATVRRAYEELARRRRIESSVGRGTFVHRPSTHFAFQRDEGARLIDLAMNHGRAGRTPVLASELIQALHSAPPDWLGDYSHEGRESALRQAGSEWLQHHRLACGEEDVHPCLGCQQAIFLVILACSKAGDRIAADELTYPGLKQTAAILDREVVAVAMDERGTRPDSLEAVCKRHRPALAYLMPTLHNPTSITMPEDRRAEIAGVIAEHRLPFIEDESLRLLHPGAPPPLTGRLPELGVFLPGFSKFVTAGPRIGFLAAPAHLREALRDALWSNIVTVPSLTALAAVRLIRSGRAKAAVQESLSGLRQRWEAARETLGTLHPPRQQDVSPYLLLGLPPGITSSELTLQAFKAGVRILPASSLRTGGQAPECIRLCITGPQTVEDLRRGLRILTGLLSESAERRAPRGLRVV